MAGWYEKNVVNTMMACVSIMGLAIVMWCAFGYSLAFGQDQGGVIGDLSYAFLNGVNWQAGPYADSIPHLVYCAFSDDVCGYYTGLIYRSFSRKNEF